MNEQVQAIATILSLVNPAISAAIFAKLETDRSARAKVLDGLQATTAIAVILVLAALFGVKVLHAFGISLDAFSVAGGFVLAWMGFAMLKGQTPGTDAAAQDQSGAEISLSPLILFAASPGTITGVITIAVAHSRTDLPVTVLVAIAVAMLVTFIAMLLISIWGGKKRGGLLRDTVSNLMGLIVLAMGVQFALTGLKSFMS